MHPPTAEPFTFSVRMPFTEFVCDPERHRTEVLYTFYRELCERAKAPNSHITITYQFSRWSGLDEQVRMQRNDTEPEPDTVRITVSAQVYDVHLREVEL